MQDKFDSTLRTSTAGPSLRRTSAWLLTRKRRVNWATSVEHAHRCDHDATMMPFISIEPLPLLLNIQQTQT